MVTVPLFGAVHVYHTDRMGPGPALIGSFDSPVAPRLSPLTEPSSPVMTAALAKLSLLGATAGPSMRVAEADAAQAPTTNAAPAALSAARRTSFLRFVRSGIPVLFA